MTQEEGTTQAQQDKDTPRSDAAVLFPDVEVSGYKIKPWNLTQATELAPCIGHVRKIIREEGITFDTLADNWMSLVERGGFLVSKVISVSIGIPEEKAGELMLDDAGAILAAIVSCNWRYLKNSLSLGRATGKIKLQVV